MVSKKLIELLLKNNIVNQKMIDDIDIQEKDNKLLIELLIESGSVTEEQIIQFLESQITELNEMIGIIQKIYNADESIRYLNYEFFRKNKKELVLRTKTNYQRIKLSTGISIIDIQHIWLIMLTHYSSMLFQRMDKNEKIDEMKNIFELLREYAEDHFIIEEQLHTIMNFSTDHAKKHQEFIEYFEKKRIHFFSLLKKDRMHINAERNEICNYLNTWILSHIAIDDTEFAIKLNKAPNKTELLNTWIEELQSKKLLRISKYQYELYNEVMQDK